MDRIYAMKDLLDEVITFVQQVYIPDVCAVAGFYPEWFEIGAGVKNYLAVPDLPLDTGSTQFDIPGGTIFDGDLAGVHPISGPRDEYWRQNVTEDVTHGWYKGSGAQHPWQGETIPEYTEFQDEGKYSWVKGPRFQGKPMQVGPLASVLVGYALGHELTRTWADAALAKVAAVAKQPVGPQHLHSTLGRHAARAVRAGVLSDLAIRHWELLTTNIAKGDGEVYNPPQFPKERVMGVGFHEAPRGTLSHWVVIENGKIANYQAVVPTTWNASPRDDNGNPGPIEQALIGTRIKDKDNPFELVRIVRSFDPCLACAIH